MARKKVSLAYISNDSKRKAVYMKKKEELIKKVSELSTLYGVEACAVIYSEYDPEPVVWPSQLVAQDILARFQKLNQESFILQRIEKAKEELRRLQKERKCRELECYMYQRCTGKITLDDIDFSDAEEMKWVIEQTLRNIQAKKDALMAAAASADAVAASLRPRM